MIIFGLLIPFLLKTQTDSIPERTKWYQPDYAIFQFAGEIGLFSAGIGSQLFKKQNGEFDFMAGYLPKSIGGDDIFTTALKFSYLPWEKPLFNNQLTWQPLSMGVILFHAWGKDINKIRDRDLYPRNYYWWSLGTRIGPLIGTRLRRDFGKNSNLESLTFYLEFVTNDLYIYSWGVNTDIIPLWAIFDMSLGIRVYW